MESQALVDVVRAVQEHDCYLLTAHVDPEGDCVASLLALDSLLRKLKKSPFILCEDPIPDHLQFLDNGRWHVLSNPSSYPEFDAGIVVDCPNLERIGRVRDVLASSKLFLINMDHHISNQAFGDINYVDAHAASCGEILYDLFKNFAIPLSDEDCRNIYVSISTDTGSFRYSNTTVKTHEIAADLLRRGLNIGSINESLYDNTPRRKMELFRIFLERIQFDDGGRMASAIIQEKDFAKTGAGRVDLEGFVEYLRSIAGVQVACLVSEQGNASHVSLRSKGNFDVNSLAGRFGGGGHRKASGCTIPLPAREAKKKIFEQFKLLGK